MAKAKRQRPTEGGSYTRDPDTGELTKNQPEPADEEQLDEQLDVDDVQSDDEE